MVKHVKDLQKSEYTNIQTLMLFTYYQFAENIKGL